MPETKTTTDTPEVDMGVIDALLSEAEASDQAAQTLLETVRRELVQADAANTAEQVRIDTDLSAELDALEAEETALLAEADRLERGE